MDKGLNISYSYIVVDIYQFEEQFFEKVHKIKNL